MKPKAPIDLTIDSLNSELWFQINIIAGAIDNVTSTREVYVMSRTDSTYFAYFAALETLFGICQCYGRIAGGSNYEDFYNIDVRMSALRRIIYRVDPSSVDSNMGNRHVYNLSEIMFEIQDNLSSLIMSAQTFQQSGSMEGSSAGSGLKAFLNETRKEISESKEKVEKKVEKKTEKKKK